MELQCVLPLIDRVLGLHFLDFIHLFMGESTSGELTQRTALSSHHVGSMKQTQVTRFRGGAFTHGESQLYFFKDDLPNCVLWPPVSPVSLKCTPTFQHPVLTSAILDFMYELHHVVSVFLASQFYPRLVYIVANDRISRLNGRIPSHCVFVLYFLHLLILADTQIDLLAW